MSTTQATAAGRAGIEGEQRRRGGGMSEACECFWTDPSTWLSAASCGYGGGYGPGSQMEWNPDCPVHGEPTQPRPNPSAEEASE